MLLEVIQPNEAGLQIWAFIIIKLNASLQQQADPWRVSKYAAHPLLGIVLFSSNILVAFAFESLKSTHKGCLAKTRTIKSDKMLFKNTTFVYYKHIKEAITAPRKQCAKWKKTYHLTILTGSFFGIIWFSHGSITGNWSTNWLLIPFITEVFSWMQFDTFSFSSNLSSKDTSETHNLLHISAAFFRSIYKFTIKLQWYHTCAAFKARISGCFHLSPGNTRLREDRVSLP